MHTGVAAAAGCRTCRRGVLAPGDWQDRLCPLLLPACVPQHVPPLCRFQTGMGYPDAAKECLLKRVRALGGAGWQASQDKFETYAHASLALCRAYLQAAQAGGSDAQRELSSARLHLRGLIKQSQERYEEHEAFQQLQQLLQSVEEEQQKQ